MQEWYKYINSVSNYAYEHLQSVGQFICGLISHSCMCIAHPRGVLKDLEKKLYLTRKGLRQQVLRCYSVL